MTVYYGLESHLDKIINIFSSGIIFEIDNINLENNDFNLKKPQKYFAQTLKDEAFNYDPFLFFRAEVLNSNSVGPSTVINAEFFISLIFEGRNEVEEWRKSFRYMRALMNIAHKNFQTDLLSNKMTLRQFTPDAFFDENGTSIVAGISLNMNIYN